MTEGAYEGVTVVDMSQGVAGPYCAAMLGLQGADGDQGRTARWRLDQVDGRRPGRASTALAIVSNLGKRSICLDAKKPEGRALVEKMASKADVLVENFRPGVMQKLGLDYARLGAVNPQLVYLSITGFGDAGPWAAKAGTDSVLQAYTGMATLNKEDSGRPQRLGMLVPDTIGALYGVQCVGARLVRAHAHRPGPADQGLARRMLRGIPGGADRRRSAVRRPPQAADRRALRRVRDRGRVHRAAHPAHRHVASGSAGRSGATGG